MVTEDVVVPDERVRVLVVDDNFVNRKVAKRLLQSVVPRRLLDVDFACNGVEAVSKFKANPWFYSIILMDIQMPLMDGREAAENIRVVETEVHRVPRTPLVAMSAGSSDHVASRGTEFDDFLEKPVFLGVLRSIVQKWLPQLA